MPQLYMIIPVGLDGNRPDNSLPPPPLGIWGGGNMPYPDQGLPGGQGGRPSQPIYHPGHPDHGLPAYPDHGLPGAQPGVPAHPIVLPEPLPPPPAEYADMVVAAVWNPATEVWTVKAAPAAQPK